MGVAMFGFEEIDAGQLSVMMSSADDIVLVDVRSPAEMAQGMLPGAEAVPMHLVPLRLDDWRDRKKVVFYCRTGARSGQVCLFLKQQGIEQVVNLRGGIVDWYRHGLPLDLPGTAHQAS
jgi:rhodanese-related sulfurtransferase